MVYRLLLDENVEHEVRHRLDNYGHDVEHVDDVSNLGKGINDGSIGGYSKDHDRIVVTYDDDFVLELSESDYRAVFYFGDETLSAKQVADVIHRVTEVYPQEKVNGLHYLGEEWL